jgi:hypothetical protein
MHRSVSCVARPVALVVLSLALAWGCAGQQNPGTGTGGTRYEDLVAFFTEWRDFQQPPLVAGVPDYSPAVMAAQHRALAQWRSRLDSIDTTGWPVARQADWYAVRAELDGLDFDHRVLRPWANNPAFYVTVFGDESDQPAREGPIAFGAVEVWSYTFPLRAQDASAMGERIRVIPSLLAQARSNLVGNQRDLWTFAPEPIRQQSADLLALAARLTDDMAALKAAVQRAKEATDTFAAWVEAQAGSKTGPSGVGADHYTWYLHHVQLVPYTWQDEVTLMERELARAHALLALEETRNEGLPAQDAIASADEHVRRFPEAVTEYLAFLRSRRLLTVKPYMEGALRARLGRFREGPREFFTEVDYRDPVVMRTHGFHWFDKAAIVHEPAPSPIRAKALLYNIFDTRTEGLATGWEEWTMSAGLFDSRPRSRELIYILVAQRAARALGDLRMHANQRTLEQASAFAAANTPLGWLSLTGNLVRGEQHLYLQQPGYGTSYLIGKMQIEQLIAVRRRQLGDRFTMNGFMDELTAAGLVPMSLISWELTRVRPEWLR